MSECERERCDACGGLAKDRSPLPYCLWCDTVIHRDCADSVACDHAHDSDWRHMFLEAAAGEIERRNGHELIVATLEVAG